METMGQRIKKTRKMMKMTQVEFAKFWEAAAYADCGVRQKYSISRSEVFIL